jgi:uncharacterized membrane protein HdeD (DUF308 family)
VSLFDDAAANVKGVAACLKGFVKDLASTNWTIFTGTVMGLLTGLVYLISIFTGQAPALDTFIAWLAFVGSWIGFGVRQFRHKRETHKLDGPQTNT